MVPLVIKHTNMTSQLVILLNNIASLLVFLLKKLDTNTLLKYNPTHIDRKREFLLVWDCIHSTVYFSFTLPLFLPPVASFHLLSPLPDFH